MRLLGALFICLLTILGAKADDFTSDGPYEAQSKLYKHVQMPKSTGCSTFLLLTDCGIDVRLTWPEDNDIGDPLRAPPFPLVLMINGYQLSMQNYEKYVDHLVSYGYVVLQYQTPPLPYFTSVKTEEQYFKPLIKWAKDQNSDPTGPLHERINLDKIGVAGHSRGGNLAALILANEKAARTGYFIDPVGENSALAGGKEDYLSAVKALRGKKLKAGVVGASIIGLCNPDWIGNFEGLFKVLGSGSWKTVVQKAGHLQFADVRGLMDVMNVFCGCYPFPDCKDKMSFVKPGMVAWFENFFRERTNPNELLHCGTEKKVNGFLEDFCEWVKQKQLKDKIEFTVKDSSPETCDWEGCEE